MADNYLTDRACVKRVDRRSSTSPTLERHIMSDMSGYIIIPEILPAHSHTMYSHGENMTMGVFSYKSCSFFYHQGRFGGQYSLFISLIEPINPLYQETNAKFPMYQSQILVRIRKPHRNHGKTVFFKKFRKKIRRAPPYASVT